MGGRSRGLGQCGRSLSAVGDRYAAPQQLPASPARHVASHRTTCAPRTHHQRASPEKGSFLLGGTRPLVWCRVYVEWLVVYRRSIHPSIEMSISPSRRRHRHPRCAGRSREPAALAATPSASPRPRCSRARLGPVSTCRVARERNAA